MRLLLFIFLAATLAASLLFAAALHTSPMRGSPGLADKEKEIAGHFENARNQRFGLCSYPDGTVGATVARYHDAEDMHADGLRCIFAPRLKFQALGVHQYLSFNLISSRFNDLSKERLEFFVKGVSGFSQARRGTVLLRENSVIKSGATLSYDIAISPEWQKISLPIGSFQVVQAEPVGSGGAQRRFSWVIGEFLFSFEPVDDTTPMEVLIADAKVFGADTLLYEVF